MSLLTKNLSETDIRLQNYLPYSIKRKSFIWQRFLGKVSISLWANLFMFCGRSSIPRFNKLENIYIYRILFTFMKKKWGQFLEEAGQPPTSHTEQRGERTHRGSQSSSARSYQQDIGKKRKEWTNVKFNKYEDPTQVMKQHNTESTEPEEKHKEQGTQRRVY